MSAMVFPAAPAVGQIFQQGESQPSYLWDGAVWKLLAQPKGVDTGGFRNVFINGDMGIYRRNYPAANLVGQAYLADRWVFNSGGTQLGGAVWVGVAPGGAGGMQGIEASRCLQLSITSVAGANNFAYLAQRIEQVQSLISGQPYTLSFWANSGGVSRPFGFEVQRYYGSGGSPSATEAKIGQKVFNTVANLWARYSHTFIVPSMAGKTLGTAGDDFVVPLFWLDTGSTYTPNSGIGQQSGTWQFANIQLERGLVATPFERRPTVIERLLCQRYFNSGNYYMMFASPSTGGFGSTQGIEFPTTMRATPTMVRNWGGYGNVASFNVSGTYPWAHYEFVVSSGMANVYGTLGWEASAEL